MKKLHEWLEEYMADIWDKQFDETLRRVNSG